MSKLSPKRLRNGKVVVLTEPGSKSILSQGKPNDKMEDTSAVTNEQGQIRSPSPWLLIGNYLVGILRFSKKVAPFSYESLQILIFCYIDLSFLSSIENSISYIE